MKWLQGTWAQRFNRHRGLVGRPFQGRYKAWHIEPGHALAQVAHNVPICNRCASRRLTEDFCYMAAASMSISCAEHGVSRAKNECGHAAGRAPAGAEEPTLPR